MHIASAVPLTGLVGEPFLRSFMKRFFHLLDRRRQEGELAEQEGQISTNISNTYLADFPCAKLICQTGPYCAIPHILVRIVV